ncbi:MAG: HAMP domain-containing sensor histidine kinase [Bacteroidales bacterium]|nr:HAMP domain-containing sensor histidine kinase [Bacteroidales bacterium]
MKLLTKSTLLIATLSLFLFFIMGVIFFQVLKNMSLSNLDRELGDLKELVEDYLEHNDGAELRSIPGLDSVWIQEVDEHVQAEDIFGDTLMLDVKDEQFRTFRYLQFNFIKEGRLFLVKIYKSTTPSDKLVERVTLMITLMVILFLTGIFILNRFIFASLWRDFFEAIEKLKRFETTKEPVILGEQDIQEFDELKQVLEVMTRRLANDYKELKEYTDHTTHELQTPLAVIKSKTELLIQSKNLGEEEMKCLEAINTSVHQLSRLNSTLTLITRIENRQFTEKEEIGLSRLLEGHLDLLQEYIELRNIKIEKHFQDGGQVLLMDQGLADLLAANLLKNAIVHNVEGGTIVLETRPGSLIIRNDGPPLAFSQEELFTRFVRDIRRSGNFGLGLSLVKKVCENYGYKINYTFENQKHTFKIVLPE